MTAQLRNEASIAEVRAATAKMAAESREAFYPHAQFLGLVAAELRVSTVQDDLIARRHWRMFTGQVQRSLGELVKAGQLVRVAGASGPLFYTPSQYAAHEAEMRRREEAWAVGQAQRERVHDELSLHGITPLSDRGDAVLLDFAGWCAVIAALDGTTAERNAG